MFSKSKAIKTAASVAGRLKPFGKKQKPKTQGFEALQGLEPDGGDQDVGTILEALTLSKTKDEKSGQAATTAGVEESSAGWTKVEEHIQPRFNAPSISFNSETSEAPWTRNWRQRDPLADERYAAATTIKTARTKGTHRPGPRTKAGVLYVDQKQGTIVFRWDVRAYPSENIKDSDPRIFYKGGVKYLKKGRYWLIVKATAKRVWEIPIYTNNNTGLQHVARKDWKEYFSLRPHDVAPEIFENQSPDNKVFAIDWMEDDSHLGERKMRPTMVAHFTEVKVRSIDVEDVRIVGALADVDIAGACGKAAPFVKA